MLGYNLCGYNFFSRDSGGGLIFFSYHPRKSSTWYYSFAIRKAYTEQNKKFFKMFVCPKENRKGQWYHSINIFWNWNIYFSFQDYHVKPK